MRILCTGNPTHQTVASAVKKLWPSADFASRATGYDFKLWASGTEKLFKKNIINYNVFINSSYVHEGSQLNLMEITLSEWMKADIKGHIINIGTTAEYTNNPQHINYIESKRQLRARSLELNDITGITGVKTTYIIVGGLNDGKPENREYLNLSSVTDLIEWVLNTTDRLPLLQIEVAK